MESKPKEEKVLAKHGKVSDQIDWKVYKFLMNERGPGYTACKPSLVQLDDGTQAIKFLIDLTAVLDDGNLYGYGIIGEIYVDYKTGEIIWATPIEELRKKSSELFKVAKPQLRPKRY
ncbi:MAG: hypothetical protein GF329_04040 [Candidatus Lokiarchaeota archaeon]|nr:hypothetical protein [Candidatus Lokiarchaeota archaeon]